MSNKTDIKILQRGGCKAGHAEIEKMIRFCLGKLMSARLANTLSIRVEFRASKLGKNVGGDCRPEGGGSKKQRIFIVRVQRDGCFTSKLETLAHELVHVAQFASGRLQQRYWKSDRQYHYRWEGEHLGTEKDNPYWNRPWEIEARNTGAELANSWVFDGLYR